MTESCEAAAVWIPPHGTEMAEEDESKLEPMLDSTNPDNNRRYQRHGFEAIGAFYPPGSDAPVTTMWRGPR